jgi:polysaccharide deacetylase 2 family uncharacterized protein YibQ
MAKKKRLWRSSGGAPVPAWFTFTIVGLVVLALGCWAMAWWLGPVPKRLPPVAPAAPVLATALAPIPVPLEAPTLPSAADALPADLSSPTMGAASLPTNLPIYQLEHEAAVGPSKTSPTVWPTLPSPTVIPAPTLPAWQTQATPVVVPAGVPRMALVIDDMGGNWALSQAMLALLPPEATLAVFPFVPQARELAQQARKAGHEVLVHLPMEPHGEGRTAPSAGPTALRVGQSAAELDHNIAASLTPLAGLAMGVNNHMGSRFTEWPDGMRHLLVRLQQAGLLFLDSKTAADTATHRAKQGLSLPVLSRDVFLDHVETEAAVRTQLQRAVAMAKQRGHVIVIGHPLPPTLAVLKADLPALVSSGVVLVPLSQVLTR